MCSQHGLTLTAPRTKPSRLCWWTCSKQEAHERIEAGMAVRCAIEEKGHIDYFWLAPHATRPGCWCMSKETPNGEMGETYTIDATGGADRWDWQCDHNQQRGFCGKVAVGCRHACAVAALLLAVGIVP